MTTARNRALDRLRQAALHARKQDELGADLLRLATYPMVQTLPPLRCA